MARHTLFTPLNAVKKSEITESHGSLIHMGVFSSSFDTMLLLSLQTKSFGFSFFFLPFLRIRLSSDTEENPRLMLVAFFCTVSFLTIVKDLRTKKRVQSWKMGHAKAVPGEILQNACVSSDLPGLTGLQSVNLLAVPRSSVWNTQCSRCCQHRCVVSLPKINLPITNYRHSPAPFWLQLLQWCAWLGLA